MITFENWLHARLILQTRSGGHIIEKLFLHCLYVVRLQYFFFYMCALVIYCAATFSNWQLSTVKVYQSIQEVYVVLQIRPTPTEELKQILANRLLHTETKVISLWRRNKIKHVVKSHRQTMTADNILPHERHSFTPRFMARPTHWLIWGKRSMSFHFQLLPLVPPSADSKEWNYFSL